MSERKKQRPVASITFHEYETEDGGVDHSVQLKARYGGLNLEFDATFDEIRRFFTEEREPGKAKQLASESESADRNHTIS